jgi:predicted dehydrogenase
VSKHDIAVFDPNLRKANTFPELLIRNTKKIPFEAFDIAFICSPTHLHVTHALAAVKAGCHIFVEKPLSHNMKDVPSLIRLAQKKGAVTMVGCNMRFHPCVEYIKKLIDRKKIGKVYSINIEYGQYLPYWRPHQDYRMGYAAKKSTGGGVIFDEMHEFDLLFWLNSNAPVSRSEFIFDKVSPLEIQTEDICLATFKFTNRVLGLVHVDYLQQSYSRTIKIIGEKGNLEWDFNENIVWLKTRQKKKELFRTKRYNVNQMFKDEITYFLDSVKKKKQTDNSIAQAARLLKYCVERK